MQVVRNETIYDGKVICGTIVAVISNLVRIINTIKVNIKRVEACWTLLSIIKNYIAQCLQLNRQPKLVIKSPTQNQLKQKYIRSMKKWYEIKQTIRN